MSRTLLCTLVSLITTPAAAELGGRVSSVDTDAVRLRASSRAVEAKPAYTTHRLTSSTTEVNEYAGPDGTVFAVSWRGPKRPDLAALLGLYYQEYAAAEPGRTVGRGARAAVIRTPRVVVSRGGQMRDLHGLAYVPALVPANVDVGGLE